ncbi:uncharacterized protein LOC113235246 isoform X2 [Hyposmocoma kahamanoa]|uniref:uncharacterized protein LOC113235246 isoform X2 n=1 Tax=Hyposmocoma kahamanoa TaxID=1477025 RepID=UPI000E6D70D0|nr:uncharacterized protein LOC113235246 isoform X2 [Hyposmocoma kahamanoa]
MTQSATQRFESGGAILGGSTAWSLMRMSYYFWTSDLGTELGTGVLFVAGAVLCLPACWLATLVPYHPRSLSLLATLMFLATGALLVLSTGLTSLTGLSRVLREPDLLNVSMRRQLSREHFDTAVKSAFAAMQLELQCCGVSSYMDWYEHHRSLPPSCCNRVFNGKREPCVNAGNASGCLRPAIFELRNYVNAVSALACVIIIVLAVTLFAGAYTMVTGVLERSVDTRLKHQPTPLRLACLHGSAFPGAPPIVSLTSPAAIPNTQQM